MLQIRPEAEADLAQAFAWYEARQRGLGSAFLGEVEAVLSRIVESPGRYPKIHREVRRALTRRFPYGVFYLAGQGRAVVIAVLHAARSPAILRKRSKPR